MLTWASFIRRSTAPDTKWSLRRWPCIGFTNIHPVREQSITDGNFPTLHSPNPEEPGCSCHGA
ncbi:MAG: hypothetical protein MZV63_25680 [Marinilabiliales bacterium]|nr:hypothetical protein [Marinilabiliales bacterium]